MEKKHEHNWIYGGAVCCGYRLYCTDCPRATEVRAVGGNPKRGDPMSLDEERDVGIRIRTVI